MPVPCTQKEVIQQLDSKVGRVIELLEEVAVQRTEIKHLMQGQGEHREWLKGLESRLRKIEIHPGQLAGRALVIICTLAGSAVGSIVSGVVVWRLSHGS